MDRTNGVDCGVQGGSSGLKQALIDLIPHSVGISPYVTRFAQVLPQYDH